MPLSVTHVKNLTAILKKFTFHTKDKPADKDNAAQILNYVTKEKLKNKEENFLLDAILFLKDYEITIETKKFPLCLTHTMRHIFTDTFIKPHGKLLMFVAEHEPKNFQQILKVCNKPYCSGVLPDSEFQLTQFIAKHKLLKLVAKNVSSDGLKLLIERAGNKISTADLEDILDIASEENKKFLKIYSNPVKENKSEDKTDKKDVVEILLSLKNLHINKPENDDLPKTESLNINEPQKNILTSFNNFRIDNQENQCPQNSPEKPLPIKKRKFESFSEEEPLPYKKRFTIALKKK